MCPHQRGPKKTKKNSVNIFDILILINYFLLNITIHVLMNCIPKNQMVTLYKILYIFRVFVLNEEVSFFLSLYFEHTTVTSFAIKLFFLHSFFKLFPHCANFHQHFWNEGEVQPAHEGPAWSLSSQISVPCKWQSTQSFYSKIFASFIFLEKAASVKSFFSEKEKKNILVMQVLVDRS